MGAACFKGNSSADTRSSTGGSRRSRGQGHTRGTAGGGRNEATVDNVIQDEVDPSFHIVDARYLPPLPRHLDNMSPSAIRSACTIDELVASTVQGVCCFRKVSLIRKLID